jgi:serine acetyltransferase
LAGLLQVIREDRASNKGTRLRLFLLSYRIGSYLTTKHIRLRGLARIGVYVVLRTLALAHSVLSHGYGGYLPFDAKLGRRVQFRHDMYGIFISNGASIGDDCILLHHVTVGSNRDVGPTTRAPQIGRRVFLGAGAKVIGDVIVGDNARIGANAIVVEDVPCDATAVSPKASIVSQRVSPTRLPRVEDARLCDTDDAGSPLDSQHHTRS